jgi:hypothetical protein
LPRSTWRKITEPSTACSADLTKYGSGSVTKCGGAAGNIGEVSSNCSAISLPQAPAALTTNGASIARVPIRHDAETFARRLEARRPGCRERSRHRARAPRARPAGVARRGFGGAVAPRPGRAARIRSEPGKAAAQFVAPDQLDREAGGRALGVVAPRAAKLLRIEREIGMDRTGRELALLADQLFDPFPLLVCAQRQRKISPGWRPCRRTLPKLTPLAWLPTAPFSSTATERPRWRRNTPSRSRPGRRR